MANGKIAFLFVSEECCTVQMCAHHICFIHSPPDGHFGYLHSVAAVNIGVWYLSEIVISFSLDIHQAVGLLNHGSTIFSFFQFY